MMANPFIKWVGGKDQLLYEITARYPKDLDKRITKYFEPFVGGGAVLFNILNLHNIEEIYISDLNPNLINTYKVVRDNVNELIILLELYQTEYLPLDKQGRTNYYNNKRFRYNTMKMSESVVENAALFIFLNRTCFNGLYRVNSKGEFNASMGSYKNQTICDKYNLLEVSKVLSGVDIVCADYKECIDYIDENSFVYLDPPYRPLSDSASFTSYTKYDFTDLDQATLAGYVVIMRDYGAKILLSNSDPKNTNQNDNFFDILYYDFNIDRVQASRNINSKGSGRGTISELLIYN